MKKQLRSDLMMLITALIWGSAFVAQRAASDTIPAFAFSGVRYMIAVMVLIPVILIMDKFKSARNEAEPLSQEERRKNRKVLLIGGTCCGVVLTLASNFQQLGVTFTTSGKAGFITSLYVVIVPLLGLLIGKNVRKLIWFCVFLAVAGLYTLAIKPGTFHLGLGDFLVLICAFFFALHILVIDHFSPKTDGVKLSCVQFIVAGIISLILMLIVETVSISELIDAAIPILYAGAISGGIAYTLQIVAQKDADPTVASLLLSMEAVFAALSGWLILGEVMTAREILGCILVFAAIILAQLPTKEEFKNRKAKKID